MLEINNLNKYRIGYNIYVSESDTPWKKVRNDNDTGRDTQSSIRIKASLC